MPRKRKLPVVNLDETVDMADWLRVRWPERWGPYKSPQFMRMLEKRGLTLEQFRRRPIYRRMVKLGRIKNDEWVG